MLAINVEPAQREQVLPLLAAMRVGFVPLESDWTWAEKHYDVQGTTRVVLQRISPTGDAVLDEHVIATVPVDDPEYDAKFLDAMSTARERRALFETEERGE